MELFWDFLFQLMKHRTNTSHVAFIFLSSVHLINGVIVRVLGVVWIALMLRHSEQKEKALHIFGDEELTS